MKKGEGERLGLPKISHLVTKEAQTGSIQKKTGFITLEWVWKISAQKKFEAIDLGLDFW